MVEEQSGEEGLLEEVKNEKGNITKGAVQKRIREIRNDPDFAVVDDKWMTGISREVNTELDRISHRLTQRIRELVERYAAPLPRLTADVEELSTKVKTDLQEMGFVW